MSEVSQVGVDHPGRLGAVQGGGRRDDGRRGDSDSYEGGIHREDDRVEVSEAAVELSRLRQDGSVRVDLIDQIRTQLSDGSYMTEQKIDEAVEAILTKLTS